MISTSYGHCIAKWLLVSYCQLIFSSVVEDVLLLEPWSGCEGRGGATWWESTE